MPASGLMFDFDFEQRQIKLRRKRKDAGRHGPERATDGN